MTSLVEKARAFLDLFRAADAPWSKVDAQRWLDGNSFAAAGLKAAHQLDKRNSVIADDIIKHAAEAQAAVVATVQAYLRDGNLDYVIRRLAASHNVEVTQWPGRAQQAAAEAPHPVDLVREQHDEQWTGADQQLLSRSTDHASSACGDAD